MRTCACKKTRRGKKITTRKQGQFNPSLKGDQMKGRRDPAALVTPLALFSSLACFNSDLSQKKIGQDKARQFSPHCAY